MVSTLWAPAGEGPTTTGERLASLLRPYPNRNPIPHGLPRADGSKPPSVASPPASLVTFRTASWATKVPRAPEPPRRQAGRVRALLFRIGCGRKQQSLPKRHGPRESPRRAAEVLPADPGKAVEGQTERLAQRARGGGPHSGEGEAEDRKREDEEAEGEGEMSLEENNMLRLGLTSLPEEKMHNVKQIVRKRNSNPEMLGDEIELHIDEMDVETQWELDRFVTNFNKALKKSQRATMMHGAISDVTSPAVAEDGIMQAAGGELTLVDHDDAESDNPVKSTAMAEQVDEYVDIGDAMPTATYQSMEIDKDAEVASGSGGSGSGSSSSSGSESGSSGDVGVCFHLVVSAVSR